MPLYDFRCPNCGNVYEVRRPASRADEPLLCMTDKTACEPVLSAPSEPAPVPALRASGWFHFGHSHDEWSGEHSHPEGVAQWSEVLAELQQQVGPWIEQLRALGVRGGDVFSACISPAIQIHGGYMSVLDAEGREIPLGGDPEASEPHQRGYLAYVWETLGRVALDQAFGTTVAQTGNGTTNAIEADAKLTVLFLLWTAPDTDTVDAQPQDVGLAFDVVRFFTQPLGIHLADWEGRIIRTEAGVVRLLSVSERAPQLLGANGADAVGRGNGQQRESSRPDVSDDVFQMRPGATALDRVHAAMLLQASGRTHALRALLRAEQDRGPDFLRLAHALSGLYPTGSEEKGLLDAALLASLA